jgi:NAD dependent epimerase/dehydratase family enzyme
MQREQVHIFVLGATGFVGQEVVKEARARGLHVSALVRTPAKAGTLADLGARIVAGDASNPADWIHETAGCDMIIDLLQPEVPRRIGLRQIRQIADQRRMLTAKLVAALQNVAEKDRPSLLSVSGLDDFAPTETGYVDDTSTLRTDFEGFAHIGIPVRRVIEESGVVHAFAHLGTVYGPGKSFADTVFPQIEAGRFRLPGSGLNRMGVVHVDDAARALVHLATLGTEQIAGRSFVLSDGHPVKMADFFSFAAEYMGATRPRTMPSFVVRLVTGSVLFETLTRDIAASPAALLQTGFKFKYPSYRDGLPPSLEALGYPRQRKTAGLLDRPQVFGALFALAVGAFLAENLLHFPLSVSYMTKLAGGAPILDMRPIYTPQEAHRLLETLGQTGRAAYLQLLWSIDLVLPALFGLFLSAAIRRGIFRAWRSVPLLGAAFDYAENIAITILLLRYPQQSPVLVWAASFFTAVKLALYSAGVLVAAAGFLMRFVKPESRPQFTAAASSSNSRS